MPSWDIRQIAVCKAKGITVDRNARILDYGCGAGGRVYELVDAGYANACGYDVLDYLKLRDPADRRRFHISPDGHIPVADASFDFVFSDQVFEHVLDQHFAWREILRVLKPGGISIHVIPAKWQIVEPHIKVPLGGLQLFKRYHYYLLWAIVGIRNEFQQGLAAHRVARLNYDYARTALNYWSSRQYRQLFRTLPITWSWEEVAYMEASYKSHIRQLGRATRHVPVIASLIRSFWMRILFLVKSEKTNNSSDDALYTYQRVEALSHLASGSKEP